MKTASFALTKILHVKKRTFIIIASVVMLLIGILRGKGGILLLINGNQVALDPPIMAGSLVARCCGAGLIAVLVVFVVSAFKLLKHNSLSGWNLSWIGMVIFLLGGLLNGFLLFGNPFVQDQVINFGASAIILLCLLAGRPAVSRT